MRGSARRRVLLRGFALAVSLWLCAALVQAGAAAAAETRVRSHAPAFDRAQGVRGWSFPRDHGQHPRYRLEWWYYTGILRTAAGRPFGYQVTFFREGLAPRASQRASAWRTESLYLAHLAVSDLAGSGFHYASRTGRDSLGLSGAAAARHQVWVGTWRTDPVDGLGRSVRIDARAAAFGVALTLSTREPPVLNGDKGLDQKGADPGEASWYYSMPRMRTSGTVWIGTERFEATGTSWMDHEFGTSQLAADQVGWDWLSLRLDSGLALMLYRLRTRAGRASPTSSGTLIDPAGKTVRLHVVDRMDQAVPSGQIAALAVPQEFWVSPKTGGKYPLLWSIRIPDRALTLEIRPALRDQELLPGVGLPFGYWEGAVWAVGGQGNRAVKGEGYLELTGYAGDLSRSLR